MSLNFKTIPGLLDYLADKFPDNEKFIMQRKVNGQFTGIYYSELRQQTISFANGLAALGIKKYDRVAIISENRPEWVYSDFAILGIGAIDVPLYPSLTADSIEFILNNSESKAVIVSNKLQLNKVLKIKNELKYLQFIIILNETDIMQGESSLYTFKDIQQMGRVFHTNHPGYYEKCVPKIKEDDICTIIYTSGTTGEPKGVLLSHRNIVSNVKAAYERLPIRENDVFLSYLPLSHIFERMAGYYTAFASGGMIVYSESIEAVANNMLIVKPTIITSVPRLFERIHSKIIKTMDAAPPSKRKIFYWAIETGKQYMAQKRTGNVGIPLLTKYKLAKKLVLDSLYDKLGGRMRFFISGGAPLARELGEFFEAAGIFIIEGYGLTEGSPVLACNEVNHFKFGTVGLPFPGVEIKFADDGEILAKGANIMQGYYKNKKETAEIIKDGWLHTGDIGNFDDDGFLVITDRKKHLFKTSTGKYIAPNPIENLFLTCKYIEYFVLIGDKRMYLSALIVPDFESLRTFASSNNIPFTSYEDLVKKKEIIELFEKEISSRQKKLANFEKIRKFSLLPKTFTQETGELTPSLKVKRKVIEEKYKEIIEKMY